MTTTSYKPRYASIAAWATALGSKAKTHAGQRKVILASFSRNTRLGRIGLMTRDYFQGNGNSIIYRNSRLHRQERFAANHPTTLAWPAPATREDLTGRHDGAATERDILTLQSDRPHAAISWVGDWAIRVEENITYDYDFYAKSYGHPKKTVESRKVLIRRIAPAGSQFPGTLESRDVDVDAFRGNYLLTALQSAGILPTLKTQMALRLNSAYEIATVRDGRLLKIYERTLGGKHIDYCAKAGDYIFHAVTVREAIAGLRKKAASSQLRAKGHAIDWNLCKSLGFCDEGIREFARAFDLSLKGVYAPSEIEQRIRQNPSAAAPFVSELRTLASAIGYAIPADLVA